MDGSNSNSILGNIRRTVSGFFNSKQDPEAQEKQAQEAQNDETVDISEKLWQDQIIAEVESKFEKAKDDRAPYELQWQLNTNFLLGNQYCDINPFTNEIIPIDKAYWYQEMECFNQIAPINETRRAKLSRVQPSMTVRPATTDFNDITAAKVSTSVVKAAQRKTNTPDKISKATAWSEQTGTAFYKTTWNHGAGKTLGYVNGKGVTEGEVDMYVATPYEIYPKSAKLSLDEQPFIIHAISYDTEAAEDMFGVRFTGEDAVVYTMGQQAGGSGGMLYNSTVPYIHPSTIEGQVLVMEYYEKPTKRYPEGRFIIVAEGKLLYYGSLPYQNKEDKKRGYPFAKQVCIEVPGNFWGQSIIERLIPIQRRYNAVKNRKQEYLNRMTLGVIEYEKGAYDIDISEEGLAPGQVLERNPNKEGARSINFGQADLSEFVSEENQLLNEFILISGVSEISRNSQAPTGAGSGVALGILMEQDDTRLSISAENIRKAVLESAKQIIRLYRQFVVGPRMDRLTGDDKEVLVTEWNKNDLTSDDIVHDTENELAQSPAQRKQQVLDMFDRGLFTDPETGQINKRMLPKIFEMLEFGNWESGTGVEDLHIKRAQRENVMLAKGAEPEIWEVDDDTLHIEEHTRFILSGEYLELREQNPEMAQTIENHLKMHESSLEFKAQKGMMQQMQMEMQGQPPMEGDPGQVM